MKIIFLFKENLEELKADKVLLTEGASNIIQLPDASHQLSMRIHRLLQLRTLTLHCRGVIVPNFS